MVACDAGLTLMLTVTVLQDPVSEMDLDQSAGVLMPFYDQDTSVLFLGGKGDGNIRYYELVLRRIRNLTTFPV